MDQRKLGLPEKVVGACLLAILLFGVLPWMNKGPALLSANKFLDEVCGADADCRARAEEHREPCMDAHSTRGKKGTISLDEYEFKKCLRVHLGMAIGPPAGRGPPPRKGPPPPAAPPP